MTRFKRWIFFPFIVLSGLMFLWLIKAPIISVYFTHTLRVPISISWIDMGFHRTNMHSFKIKNPKEFHHSRNALKVKKIECDYNVKRLFSDPAVIDQITLQHVTLRVDLVQSVGMRNNWTVIGEEMYPSKTQKRMVIRKFVLEDLTIEIQGVNLMLKPQTFHFDHLEVENIDSHHGFPTEELIEDIFKGGGILQYLQNFLNPIKNFHKLINPFHIFPR